MDYVKQSFWDSIYEKKVDKYPENEVLNDWIKTIVKPGRGECLEIGTYPGKLIEQFARLGYTVSGIDLTPKVKDLNFIFKERGYKVREFSQVDFFKYNTPNKFDIVCSFGFVEHFDDYESVILKHGDYLKDDGMLLITVPNFQGFFQYWMHKLVDNRNLEKHNLLSMNVENWKALLEKNGYSIIYSGYIGAFDFWNGEQDRNYLQIILRRLFCNLVPLLSKILKSGNKMYSPYCGIAAIKKS